MGQLTGKQGFGGRCDIQSKDLAISLPRDSSTD